jgi:hypothetical protein
VNWLGAQDADDWLAYSTIKVVQIRDRYLGALHYSFQIAIFIYIIVFVIVVQKGYMLFDSPSGSVQFTVRRCVSASACPETAVAGLPYCNEGANSGANFVVGCRLLDEFDSVVGLDSAAFYAVSRITDTLQVRNASCPDRIYGSGTSVCSRLWVDAPLALINASLLDAANTSMAASNAIAAEWAWTARGAAPPPLSSRATYYIPEIENISIKLEHNVNALAFLESRPNADDLQGVSTELDGKLQYLTSDVTGRILSFIGLSDRDVDLPAGRNVLLTLGQLVEAAGVSGGLDTKSSQMSNTSMRYDGIVLIMVLTYENDYPPVIATGTVRYNIKVFRVRGAEFKYEYIVPLAPDVRVLRNTHGVRVIFLQKGKLGRFSFQVLLLQLVSALALLSIATTIVDLLALRLMPHKGYYKDLKFQVSRDFSDVRSEDRRASLGGEPKKIEHVEDGDDDGTDSRRT